MTVMGMAASQARFLGLTARKSNVEYQGQQINQQRTALANESSNLYNQMLQLDVPTPPSQKDYYNTVYILDGTGDGYGASDYEIASLSKTYNQDNQYVINLSREIETLKMTNDTFDYKGFQSSELEGKTVKTISLQNADTKTMMKLNAVFIQGTTTEEVEGDNGATETVTVPTLELESMFDSDGKAKDLTPYQIYAIDPEKAPAGYATAVAELEEGAAPPAYFYTDSKGKNHFMTADQFEALMDPETEADTDFVFDREYAIKSTVMQQAIGILETSDNGRYSSITFDDSEDNPSSLKGKTISLTAVQELDEDGYNEAMNDYEYNKELYEKSIADINAQSEQVQKKDQQLELRLEQLDTEQNAISTEMEAVQKVIEDNVENTFKVFA